MHPTNCLNCGSNLNGYKFCPACGQKAATHRLTFHELWHDILHYFTHADKGIFHLVGELAVRPGVVAREYVAGKRAKYFKPVNFFLVVGTFVVFMISYFHLPTDSLVKQMEQAAASSNDAVRQKQLAGMAERTRQVYHYIGKYTNVMNMLITPLYAFIFWLFYKKARYSYIEHLVAGLYFISFIMLVNSLLVVPWQSKLSLSKMNWLFSLAYVVVDIIYRSFAYRQFMGKKGAGPFFKAMGISVFTLLLWVIGSYILLQAYIMTGFE